VKGLLEAWVARLAECRLEQKAGYSQHAILNSCNPTILNILVNMKNNGKSDYTIKFVDKSLRMIDVYADLDNPEAVKQYIANKDVSDSYKKTLCIAYNHYCKYYKIHWEMPLYKADSKQIRIPTTEKLEKLIAYARRTLSIQLRISKETGLRPVELCNLKVKDIDLEQRNIHPKTAKNGSPRTLRISHSLKDAITDHIVSQDLNPNDKLFKASADQYGKSYRTTRNSLAKKLNDPSLKQIRLYDFRHFFATMLYHRTRDILYVKQQMGHKKIETTLLYTQLIDFGSDEYHVKTAKTIKEACSLAQQGFEYFCEMNGTKILRKRK